VFNLKNNLTTVILLIGLVLVILFIGALVLFDKDPTAYLGSISTLIGIISASGLLAGRLDTVSKNVNGNSTKLLDENKRLRAGVQVLLAKAVPDDRPVEEILPDLMSDDTIARITADKDKLPAHRADETSPSATT
jgi:hypothetical protein